MPFSHGRFERIGIYVVMFGGIVRTLMCIMILFIFLLLAFGLAFYALMLHQVSPNREIISAQHDRPVRSWQIGASQIMMFTVCCFRQDEFSSISLALAQTFVMTVGELNYQSTFLNAYENSRMAFPGVTYLIFVLFVLLMPILLMNLMVGHSTLACWKPTIIVNDGCNLLGCIRLICLNHVADWFGGRRYCRGTKKCRVEEDSHAGEQTDLIHANF